MEADITIEGFGMIHAEIMPTELKGQRGFCCTVRIRGEIFSTTLFANGFAYDKQRHRSDWEMLKRIKGPGLETLEKIVRAIKIQENRVLRQRDLLKKTLKASRN